jgi:glycosyltransferase involved in cell wall biosynthesis
MAEKSMPRLSAIIIAKNEAQNIEECLGSVNFCDERIVVIDTASIDDTAQRAELKGARVTRHDFQGFGAQKSFALAQAQGDWVLSIDADERVSAELAAEIRAAMANDAVDGFEMPRCSRFCGRVMRHSGWYPDYVLRLFRRARARFSQDIVHERVICDGVVARLREPLDHFPVRRIEDALSRMDRYSTANAAMMIASGQRVSILSGITHGLFAFLKAYVLRAGFLDGREGFFLAIAIAEGSYYRYVKAWLLGREHD